METQKLKELIKNAFSHENLPKNVSDGCSRDICQEIESRFHNKTREALSNEDIFFLSGNFVLLDSDAFRYYCSPILIAAIEERTQIDFESLIQNFIFYPGMMDYQNYTKNRLDQFSKQESQVIYLILKFWLRKPNIEDYWKEKIELSIPYWQKKI